MDRATEGSAVSEALGNVYKYRCFIQFFYGNII